MTKVNETLLSAFKERVAPRRSAGSGSLELEDVGPGRAKASMVCRPEMANIRRWCTARPSSPWWTRPSRRR